MTSKQFEGDATTPLTVDETVDAERRAAEMDLRQDYRADPDAPDTPLPPPDAERLPHYVSPVPFDPRAVEKLTPEQERIYFASQRKLMWWKFTKHKVALWSGVFLLALYIAIVFAEWLSPWNYQERHSRYIYMPPQGIHLFHEGQYRGPFVYGVKRELNMDTLQREYTTDTSKIHELSFFCSGSPYYWMGLIPADNHFVCAPKGAPFFLLGTDRLGRDMLSRIIQGARISLTIGLIGIAVSFLLGIVLGGLAGYYGGWVDMVVQRMIEVLQSIPTIPLWLALSAIMPDRKSVV